MTRLSINAEGLAVRGIPTDFWDAPQVVNRRLAAATGYKFLDFVGSGGSVKAP